MISRYIHPGLNEPRIWQLWVCFGCLFSYSNTSSIYFCKIILFAEDLQKQFQFMRKWSLKRVERQKTKYCLLSKSLSFTMRILWYGLIPAAAKVHCGSEGQNNPFNRYTDYTLN